LDGRKFGEQAASFHRNLKSSAAAVGRVDSFMDETSLREPVRNCRDESAAQIYMIGYTLDVHDTLIARCLIEISTAYSIPPSPIRAGVSGTDCFVKCQESE